MENLDYLFNMGTLLLVFDWLHCATAGLIACHTWLRKKSQQIKWESKSIEEMFDLKHHMKIQ